MDPCRNVQCILLRLRERNGFAVQTATEAVVADMPPQPVNEDNLRVGRNNLAAESTFRILLPILIVLGVFIILALSLILYRLLVKLMEKRNSLRESDLTVHQQSNNSARRIPISSGRYVNTLSSHNTDNPPTYNDVLAHIESGEAPPAYYLVMNGVINVGYLHDGANEATRQVETVGETATSNQSNMEVNAAASPPEYSISNAPVEEEFEVPDGPSPLPNETDETSASVPAECPACRTVVHDENVVDSIAVPSNPVDLPSFLDCNTIKIDTSKCSKKRSSPVNAVFPLTDAVRDHMTTVSRTGISLAKVTALNPTLGTAGVQRGFMMQTTSV